MKMDADSSHMPVKREKSSAEVRKSNKPLMEKRRRERINTCLDQLKSILMEVTKKESSYYSKLEKADILEMTVKYLKNAKRNQVAALNQDPAVLNKYIAGYNECTNEVTKYLSGVEALTPETRTRLIGHLANSLQCNNASVAVAPAKTGLVLPNTSVPTATQLTALPGNVCMINQTTAGHVQTVPTAAPMQLVPAKLATGEVVLLLANPHNISAVPVTQSNMSVLSTDMGKFNQTHNLLHQNVPQIPSPTPSSSTSSSSSSSSSSSPPPNHPLLSPCPSREENNNNLSPLSSPPPLDLSNANNALQDDRQRVALNLSQPKHGSTSSLTRPYEPATSQTSFYTHPSHQPTPTLPYTTADLQTSTGLGQYLPSTDQQRQDDLNNNLNLHQLKASMWRPW